MISTHANDFFENQKRAVLFFDFLARCDKIDVLEAEHLDWKTLCWLDDMSPAYFIVNWNFGFIIPKTPEEVLKTLWDQTNKEA